MIVIHELFGLSYSKQEIMSALGTQYGVGAKAGAGLYAEAMSVLTEQDEVEQRNARQTVRQKIRALTRKAIDAGKLSVAANLLRLEAQIGGTLIVKVEHRGLPGGQPSEEAFDRKLESASEAELAYYEQHGQWPEQDGQPATH